MNRRISYRAFLAALLCLSVLGVGGATADPAVDAPSQQLFLRNDGVDCGTGDHPFLSTEAGTEDINCGYIGGGLPFGEVFHQTELAGGRTFGTEDEIAVVLDTTRKVAGVVTVRAGSQQGQALPGGGQIVADIALRAYGARGATVDFGAQTLETIAPPGTERVELPFTFEVPADAEGKTLDMVEFDLNVRGVHVWHGFMELNGKTSFTLPTVAPVAA